MIFRHLLRIEIQRHNFLCNNLLYFDRNQRWTKRNQLCQSANWRSRIAICIYISDLWWKTDILQGYKETQIVDEDRLTGYSMNKISVCIHGTFSFVILMLYCGPLWDFASQYYDYSRYLFGKSTEFKRYWSIT